MFPNGNEVCFIVKFEFIGNNPVHNEPEENGKPKTNDKASYQAMNLIVTRPV